MTFKTKALLPGSSCFPTAADTSIWAIWTLFATTQELALMGQEQRVPKDAGNARVLKGISPGKKAGSWKGICIAPKIADSSIRGTDVTHEKLGALWEIWRGGSASLLPRKGRGDAAVAPFTKEDCPLGNTARRWDPPSLPARGS